MYRSFFVRVFCAAPLCVLDCRRAAKLYDRIKRLIFHGFSQSLEFHEYMYQRTARTACLKHKTLRITTIISKNKTKVLELWQLTAKVPYGLLPYGLLNAHHEI